MDSITQLKNELIIQKTEIEKMYGKVNVANTNPSPAEITAGIKSIPSVDLSNSTATEEDVKQGKTFYSNSPILKTGTAIFDTNATNMIFWGTEEQVDSEDEYYYTIPSHVTLVSRYKFYKNYNHVTVRFQDNIKTIDEYAFFKTINFKFENFNDLTQLTRINSYAFANSTCDGIDIGHLPHSITYLGQYAFYQVEQHNVNFRFPNALTNVGGYTFMASKRLYQKDLDLSNYKLANIATNCFYYNCFDCDFVAPTTLKTLSSYCFYNGGFHKATIPITLTSLENYCMGGTTAHTIDNFYLKKVVFESETPPKIGTRVFAIQNIENGMKIYVPDNAVDAYKAVANMEPYLNIILPMSQMP